MKTIKDILSTIGNMIAPKHEMVSPIPRSRRDPLGELDPNNPALTLQNLSEAKEMPGDKVGYWRNPQMEQWANHSPRFKIDEIKSALDIASQRHPTVRRDLLGDVMGLESMAGFYDRPLAKGYEDESQPRGPFMFKAATGSAVGLAPEDRYEATASAIAAAQKIARGQLGEWDVTNNPGAGGRMLSDFYTPQELAPYLKNSTLRWAK